MTYSLEYFLKKQDVKFYKAFSMKKLSAIGIGGCADVIAFPDSREKLISLVDFAVDKIPYKVIGKMTNLLPCDNVYHGMLISTKKINKFYKSKDIVCADCGVILTTLIYKLAEVGIGGMSGLYGIPGCIGGAVFGNAGAYDTAVSEIFSEGDFYSPHDKKVIRLDSSEMKFKYRESILKDSELIVLSANFKISNVSAPLEKETLKSTLLKRMKSQPYGDKSLGSVFKRYNGIPVSKLIDNLGLKGYSVGDAQVSDKHAGFIINKGNASEKDYRELVSIIKNKVKERYGFIPEEEIGYLNGG